MKQKFFLLWLAALLLAAGAGVMFLDIGGSPQPAEGPTKKISYDTSCVTEETRTIRGSSMSETFKDGEAVAMLYGYFDCNKRESGQIAVLEFSTRKESFVKRLVAMSGDMIEFNEGKAILNGDLLKNPARALTINFQRSPSVFFRWGYRKT